MELIYHIIRLLPSRDLDPLLAVSTSIRKEARIFLFRSVRLQSDKSVAKFALIVPDVGDFVRSLTLRICLSDDNKTDVQLILESVPGLKELIVGRSIELRLSNPEFLPTQTRFHLHTLILRGRTTGLEKVVPFLQTQCESLEQLYLMSGRGYYPSALLSLQFARLRVLRTISVLVWDILRQGTVVCASGRIENLPPGCSFPAVRAIDCFDASNSTLMALPDVFPEVRFIQATMVMSGASQLPILNLSYNPRTMRNPSTYSHSPDFLSWRS